MLGVVHDVVLQELMELVEAVVAHEQVDDKLVKVMLYRNLEDVQGANVLDKYRNERAIIEILQKTRQRVKV